MVLSHSCSCAQSASYTLLGESCSERVRDSYMLIMTSVLDFSLAAYVGKKLIISILGKIVKL